MTGPDHYDALVIGGGIVGRCALYHLQRRGLRRVGLVERFGADHGRGSSHSHSRITRSAYVSAGYVRLMQVAHGQEWPRLEADAGERLILPNEGCFFGDSGGTFEAYAKAVQEVGVDCDVIDIPEARRRFPMLRLPTAVGAVHDRTSGVVAAARTMAALRRLAEAGGADLLFDTQVEAIELTQDPVRVDVRRGDESAQLHAERVVVTTGPWATQLLPFLRQRLRVARQTVGYFELAVEDLADLGVGRWPVWGNLGVPGEKFYGLPAFGRPGIKIARHITAGADDDPDDTPAPPAEGFDEAAFQADEIDRLRAFLEREFVPPATRLLGLEHCHYTNTATEDYIVDRHPDSERVALGAGFSGHGFKLGPVCGRVLADLAMDGRCDLPEYRAMQETFSVAGP
jgi:sarcosine oxidase